jgi:hypothetical protein
MTTAVLPFVGQRPRRSTQAWRWILSGRFNQWYYLAGPNGPEQFWRQNERAVIEHFAVRSPGRRPWAWWKFSAPEPRRRLGGRGTPLCEFTAYAPELHFGIPAFWRRANDFCDLLKLDERRWPAIDPDDPPIYESEATYLKRLRLLLPGEARRLRRADYAPEAVR